MTHNTKPYPQLIEEIEQLRYRLAEAEETLRAIHQGEADALVISGGEETQIFTLQNADTPYRIMVESMQEGAVTLSSDGKILYCNQRFAELLKLPLQQVQGASIYAFTPPDSQRIFQKLLHQQGQETQAEEAVLLSSDGVAVPVYLAHNALILDAIPVMCFVVTDLTYYKRHVEQMHFLLTLSLAISQLPTLEAALTLALQEIAQATDWVIGEAWLPGRDGMSLTYTTQRNMTFPILSFEEASEEIIYSPGQGLVGKAWKTRQPVWMYDISQESGSPRAALAHQAGLKTAVAIPVLVDQQVLAILTFFSFQAHEVHEPFIQLITAVAAQLGSFIQRKQAERKLQQSEARFRTSIDNMLDPFVILTATRDQSGVIVDFTYDYANPAACKFIGVTAEKIVGERLLDFVPGHRQNGLFDTYCRVIETGIPLVKESFSHTEKVRGQPLKGFYDIQVTKLDDSLAYTWRDVTAPRRVEQALRDSEALLRKVWNSAADAMALSDPAGIVLMANPAYLKLYGYPEEVVVGNPFEIIYPEAARSQARDRYIAFFEASTPSPSIESLVQRSDGAERYVESNADFITQNGQRIAMLSIIRDITERKQAENALRASEVRFRLLYEHSPVAIAILRTGVFLSTNHAYLDLFGNEDADLAGRFFADHIASDYRQDILHKIEAKNNLLPLSMDTLGQRSDGSRFPIHVGIGSIPLEDGLAQVLFILDLTERRRLEEQTLHTEKLRVELQKEKELVDLKDRFATTVSHEFRTPLTVIRMTNELLANYADQFPVEKKQKYFKDIEAKISYMVRMLDDMLIIGKAKAGKIEFAPVPVQVESLCRSILEEVQIADADLHQFSFINHSQHERASLDERLIRHILFNLMSNATKYSPAGSAIRLALSDENAFLTFCVSDRGIGIPLADQPHLFEAFHRATNAVKVPGTGLGLSIVKASVEAHGGIITFKSQENVGTTFIVSLPVASDRAAWS